MQIKIGLVHTGREVTVTSDQDQEAIVTQLQDFLASSDDSATTILQDTKGSRFILVRNQVAYVEVGTSKPRSVGFI